MDWSDHQLKIFDWIVERKGNAAVRACAGSGKTTTIVEALNRVPDRPAIVLAFNKEIKLELEKRLTHPNHTALTMHGLCYRALMKFMKVGPPDNKKMRTLARELAKTQKIPYSNRLLAISLASKAKEVGLGALMPDDDASWASVAGELNIRPDGETAAFARALLAKSIEATHDAHFIDFDDQIYHCLLDDIPLPSFDLLFVDEAQDLNRVQHEILKRLAGTTGQVVVVGDPDQAIYSFRGAAADSFYRLSEMFNCTELPLTVSYRCSATVVKFVNDRGLSSHLEASPTAVEGEARASAPRWGEMEPAGDVILCRNNAPLFGLALRLLAAERPVNILGKGDILGRLTRFIGRFPDVTTCESLLVEMGTYVYGEVQKLTEKDEDLRAAELNDQYACIQALAAPLPVNSPPSALIDKLSALLSKRGESAGLTLSTVHQAKGREWSRVWVLRPDLLSPSWLRAKLDREKRKILPDEVRIEKLRFEIEQERHVEYVAYTRAKMGLYLMQWTDEQEIPIERPPEYYAELDRQRNERDRLAKRGAPYDGRRLEWEQVSGQIAFGFNPPRGNGRVVARRSKSRP